MDNVPAPAQPPDLGHMSVLLMLMWPRSHASGGNGTLCMAGGSRLCPRLPAIPIHAIDERRERAVEVGDRAVATDLELELARPIAHAPHSSW